MAVNVSVVTVVSTIHEKKKIHFLSLWGIYPKEMLRDRHKEVSPRMPILVLNIIEQNWK